MFIVLRFRPRTHFIFAAGLLWLFLFGALFFLWHVARNFASGWRFRCVIPASRADIATLKSFARPNGEKLGFTHFFGANSARCVIRTPTISKTIRLLT